MSDAVAPIAEGDLLAGKYRVERVLGAGGMGIVVAARHLQLDQRVALKFLLPEATQHESAVERFIREARAAAKLKSEHVARVIDVGELGDDAKDAEGRSFAGAPYMVMEYLEGSDLSNVIHREGALVVDDAIKYVLEACEAIAEAHSVGIIHRDLKPANLFLTKAADGSPMIKVLDFGISKIKEAQSDQQAMALTKTHALLGSPLYMSPEAMKSAKKVAEPTDQWALGVILFECLTGTRPFTGDSITELAYNVMAEPHPRPRSLRPDISERLEAVLDRVLQKDPKNRFPSVGEFAWALSECSSKPFTQSAERIARMLETAGVKVEAKSLPPPSLTPSPTGSQTAATWTPETEKRPAPPASTLSRFALPIAAGLGVLAMAIVIVPRFLRGNAEASPDQPQLVAPASTTIVTSATSTAGATAVTTPAPTANAAPTVAPTVSTTAKANAPIEITPSHLPPPKPRNEEEKAKPIPSAVPVVAPPPPVTPPTPPPTAPPVKKNPLNIDIK